MKFLVCVITAFAVLQNVGSWHFENRLEASKRLFEQSEVMAAASYNIDVVCPGYGDKLENVTMEIATCPDIFDDTEETTCSIVKNNAKRCLNPLVSMFEECLPTQTKQLPSMVVDMIISTSNYFCKTDGEHIFELGNSCIKNTNPKTQRCIRRIATKFQQYQSEETLPSVTDLCDFSESLRPCLQSHLNTACGRPITREAFLNLFDQAMKVCEIYKKNDLDVVQ